MKSSAPAPRSGCRPAVLQTKLGKAAAEELAAALRVIADPARLRLLSFLAMQATGDACVCHLTRPLGLTQPTVSHHLRVLFEAGLVARERRGTWVYYRLRPERLGALRDALALPAPAVRGQSPVTPIVRTGARPIRRRA